MTRHIRFKNTLCLALALSLLGTWPSSTVSGAGEYQEPVSEDSVRREGESSSEEATEPTPSAKQEDIKEPQNSKHVELLKDIGQVALSVAAVPVFAAAQMLMFGVVVVYGTVYGVYYCCKEVGKRAKERLAPSKNKGDSHEND
jgi:hypothetical protein